VEQGGADAADSLVPPGNADAVEAALALHLAEEGDGQDGRDPARLLADAVEVPEPADGRQIRLAGGDFPQDLFARPRFDFPVAAEAAGKEREPADDRRVGAEEVEGLDAQLVAGKLFGPVPCAKEPRQHVRARSLLVLVEGALDAQEKPVARLERADRKSTRLNSSHRTISY